MLHDNVGLYMKIFNFYLVILKSIGKDWWRQSQIYDDAQ